LAVQTASRVPLRLHALVLFPQRRELLHEVIARRFRLMLEQGFLEEVGRLKAEYPSLTAEHNSMRCVGYRQAWDYLDGTCAYDAFVDAGIAATRQLAKRQLTWLRKTEADTLLDPYDGADVFQTASAASLFPYPAARRPPCSCAPPVVRRQSLCGSASANRHGARDTGFPKRCW